MLREKKLSCLLVCFFMISVVSAETYIYSGPNFSDFYGNYSASDSIDASFDVDNAFPANMAYTDVSAQVTSYEFSDGQQILTEDNSYLAYFRLSTDANGDPSEWLLSVYRNQVEEGTFISLVETYFDQGELFQEIGSQDSTCNENLGPNGQCSASVSNSVNSANNFVFPAAVSPGTWDRGSVPPPPVPQVIPVLSVSTMLFMSILLMMSGFMFLRKQNK